jgi:exosome complex component RRP42
MATALSAGEAAYIAGGAAAGVRGDGRARLDLRPVELATGVAPQCYGSARARVGGTEVVVGVLAEAGPPPAGRPGEGALHFAVAVSPVAGPALRGRAGEELAAELARALERAYHAPPGDGEGGGDAAAAAAAAAAAPLDLRQLSLVAGKAAWALTVDALVLSADGAVLDALSLAVKAALADTELPTAAAAAPGAGGDDAGGDADDFELSEETAALDAACAPLYLSLAALGGVAVADPAAAEEAAAAALAAVAVDPEGGVRALATRGRAPLEAAALAGMVGEAQALAPAAHAALARFLAGRPHGDGADGMALG